MAAITPESLDPIAPDYSLAEEVANAVTHGIGAALSIAGLSVLVVLASLKGDGWLIASAIVYGTSLVVLYTASTLYHALPMPRVKHILKILDHSAIYLLIAGSYTPFTLITLRHVGGLWLFGVVWGLAVLGVSLEATWVYRPKWLSALVYIAMGWLVIFMIKPLIATLAVGGIVLLILGGLSYTLGTAFYVMKSRRYMHAVWHGFVLAASVLQYLAIAIYVFPR